MTLRVMSNVPGLRNVKWTGSELTFVPYPSGKGALVALRAFFASFRCDYLLLNGAPRDLLLLCLFKTVVPFNPCRIVAMDVLFSEPHSRVDRAKSWLRGALLKQAYKIIVYYKDTKALRRTFGLPQSSFDFVPFKINQYELVTSTTPTDQGYIFCGGKTRRDFKTLLEAVADLDYPVKIVTTPNSDIVQHGSYLDEGLALPPTVEVVRLDGSGPPFVRLMAGARLVVLPLKPDITGVGIGVYIMAMALRKCVIITSGPSVDGVLTSDVAMIVPPQDPRALRAAISAAWKDDAFRNRIAETAYAYAMSLGGEDRLYQSVADYLIADSLTPIAARPAAAQK